MAEPESPPDLTPTKLSLPRVLLGATLVCGLSSVESIAGTVVAHEQVGHGAVNIFSQLLTMGKVNLWPALTATAGEFSVGFQTHRAQIPGELDLATTFGGHVFEQAFFTSLLALGLSRLLCSKDLNSRKIGAISFVTGIIGWANNFDVLFQIGQQRGDFYQALEPLKNLGVPDIVAQNLPLAFVGLSILAAVSLATKITWDYRKRQGEGAPDILKNVTTGCNLLSE